MSIEESGQLDMSYVITLYREQRGRFSRDQFIEIVSKIAPKAQFQGGSINAGFRVELPDETVATVQEKLGKIAVVEPLTNLKLL